MNIFKYNCTLYKIKVKNIREKCSR